MTAVVSLLVYVVVTDASGQESTLGESLAAGFESWRTEVWGSPQVRALGAEFFPRLALGNEVRIKPHEVARFQHECALLREHLDAICGAVELSGQHGTSVDLATGQVSRPGASHEAFRQLVDLHLANIEETAQRAAQAGGQIAIW
ncbi:MAG: hypothetical protein J2P28_07925 [Actinobacteria bacterium]|nr:hypothetical protein [Actinomycetota bacterium]